VWVEGAGSFYSPLASDGLNADLAERLGMTPQAIANRPNKHRCPREFSKGGKLQVVKAIMIKTPMFDFPLERVHNLVAERDSFEFAGSQ
jgi:hypothetical protein